MVKDIHERKNGYIQRKSNNHNNDPSDDSGKKTAAKAMDININIINNNINYECK